MTKKIGLLGCGKIGRQILEHIVTTTDSQISFVQDLFYQPENEENFPNVQKQDISLLQKTDLVIECATADVLKQNFDEMIKYCDLLIFSVTAFCDAQFEEHAKQMAQQYQHHIYLPHGAILGIDGIFDGRTLISSVSIVTTKNPKSLGRADIQRTVVYEGSARQACQLYPRNVNVHATIALVGIGFDKTQSVIISDPTVSTNSHTISVQGDGIFFQIEISSFASGGVTGQYTPYSACGSVDRILNQNRDVFCFV